MLPRIEITDEDDDKQTPQIILCTLRATPTRTFTPGPNQFLTVNFRMSVAQPSRRSFDSLSKASFDSSLRRSSPPPSEQSYDPPRSRSLDTRPLEMAPYGGRSPTLGAKVTPKMRDGWEYNHAKFKVVDEKIVDLDVRVGALDHQMKALDNKVSVLDDKVAALDNKVAALDNKVAALDNKVAALDNKVTALDDKVIALDQKIDSVKTELKADIQGMKDEFNVQFLVLRSLIENLLGGKATPTPANVIANPTAPPSDPSSSATPHGPAPLADDRRPAGVHPAAGPAVTAGSPIMRSVERPSGAAGLLGARITENVNLDADPGPVPRVERAPSPVTQTSLPFPPRSLTRGRLNDPSPPATIPVLHLQVPGFPGSAPRAAQASPTESILGLPEARPLPSAIGSPVRGRSNDPSPTVSSPTYLAVPGAAEQSRENTDRRPNFLKRTGVKLRRSFSDLSSLKSRKREATE